LIPSYQRRLLTNLYSRQIRPPIYSLKQSKLRKRRVIRYAIMYFFLLVIFVLLVAGPLIARSKIPMSDFEKQFKEGILNGLMQPLDSGLKHNDTWTGHTGHNLPGGKTGESAIPSAELWTQATGSSTGGAKMMFVL